MSVDKLRTRALVPYAHTNDSLVLLARQANEILGKALLTDSCKSLPLVVEKIDELVVNGTEAHDRVSRYLERGRADAERECGSETDDISQLRCFYDSFVNLTKFVDDNEEAAQKFENDGIAKFSSVRSAVWQCVGNTLSV